MLNMNENNNVTANKAYKAYCASVPEGQTAVSFKQWLIDQKQKNDVDANGRVIYDKTPEPKNLKEFLNADAAPSAPETSIRVLGMPIVVAVPVLLVGAYAAYRLVKFLVNRKKTATA